MVEEAIRQAQERAAELAVELERGAGARELALVQTKLEEAELWLARSRERNLDASTETS